MIFINPWAFYHPDDIPNLTPQDDEEMLGCIACAYGYIVSTIIYVLFAYLCFTLTKGMLTQILFLIDSAVIYPITMIYLVNLSFKIRDKIYKKKRNKKENKL